jgi:CRP-like cAMP-binding protein
MVFGRSTKVLMLEKVPLFSGLSRRQLEQVAQIVDEIEVPAGRRLATAGAGGHELFVIVKGTAKVRPPRGRTVQLGPGDFFGEMSLVDGGPRSADVDADTALQLLVVGRRAFWQLLEAAPPLVPKIMSTLSRRLREAQASISG